MRSRAPWIASLIAITVSTLAACGGDGGSGGGGETGGGGAGGATGGGDSGGDGGSGAGTTSASDGSGGEALGCGAKVTIAFYPDDTCTPGTEKGKRAYNTGLECFSWTAMGCKAEENSATQFQCYSDRLCYTQHPNTLMCDDGGLGQTDKQARNAECLKEPDGMLYSRILGGNEGCPPPPAGFECPLSASKMGTPGIAACHSEQ